MSDSDEASASHFIQVKTRVSHLAQWRVSVEPRRARVWTRASNWPVKGSRGRPWWKMTHRISLINAASQRCEIIYRGLFTQKLWRIAWARDPGVHIISGSHGDGIFTLSKSQSSASKSDGHFSAACVGHLSSRWNVYVTARVRDSCPRCHQQQSDPMMRSGASGFQLLSSLLIRSSCSLEAAVGVWKLEELFFSSGFFSELPNKTDFKIIY